ncbi:MAG: flagellar motor protein MotB [Planctomycetes bacterium RBG_13_63_9]|nr:MAG: flagellar motor protein MotB [Planctomycetes bacterium RBG_13_63_9]
MATVEEEPEAGVPEWVVTFGDMMSLLLTFFIMLFSMSEIKEKELYQAMMEAMRRRFGYQQSTASMMPGPTKPRNSLMAELASLGRALREHTLDGGDRVHAPVGDYPRVQSIQKGDHTTRGGVVFFAEGSAELTEKSKQILHTVAEVIGGKAQKIEIRGHTSTKPLSADSPFKDHWDLAYARCRSVKDYLVKLGIDPKRIRLDVAADNEPRHTTPDPLLLKQNARVEIFMLDEITREGPETRGEGQPGFSGKGPQTSGT